ncbi:MAG: TonB-dependent receptor [Pseudomonadota bacterium]
MFKVLLGASTALVPLSALASTDVPEADQIIVTASPLNKPASELSSPVAVVTGDELKKQLRATLGETLGREAGISTTFFGPGASRPVIRGLGGDRVRTLTNGVGTIDAAASSPDHATPIDPLLAQRIEIVRGPQILRYGSSAAGGVINVFDGRIPSEVPEDSVNVIARTAYSTVDEGFENSLAGSFVVGQVKGLDVVLTAAAATRDADDYDIPGFAESSILRSMEEEEEHDDDHDDDHDEDEEEIRDTLENSFVEQQTFSGGLSFIGEKGFLGFSVQHTEKEYGLAGGHDHGHGHEEEEHDDEDHDEEEEEGGAFLDLEQTRYDLNGSFQTGGFIDRIDVYAGVADYEHVEFEAPGEQGTVFSNEGFEGRFEAVQATNGNWSGATGIQIRSRTFSAIGEEAYVTETEKDQVGLFTFQEVDLGTATIGAAARFEQTQLDNPESGVDRQFDGFSASLSGTMRPSEGLTVTANLFRNERAPTTEELFSNGPHLAVGAFEIGDTNLDIETATGLELGARINGDRFRASLTAFVNSYDDFIYQEQTGLTGADILMMRGEDDEEELEEFGELPVLQYIAADATFVGFEFEADVDLGEFGAFEVSTDLVVDYVEATLNEADSMGNDHLPRIPPLGVTVGLDAQAPFGSFRAEVEHAAEVDDVASFELPTDAFTLLNLYADWEIVPNLSFEVAALNLLDEEARVHTSFVKDEVPLPGRNLRFALRYEY